jgi:hypothetical protein
LPLILRCRSRYTLPAKLKHDLTVLEAQQQIEIENINRKIEELQKMVLSQSSAPK